MLSKRPEKNITSTYCYLTCNNKRHLAIRDYLPELRRARAARDKSLQDIKDESMNRLMKDIAIDRAENPGAPLEDRWNSDDEGDDDGDINIIDKSMFIAPSFFFCLLFFLPNLCILQARTRGQVNILMSHGRVATVMRISIGPVQVNGYYATVFRLISTG